MWGVRHNSVRAPGAHSAALLPPKPSRPEQRLTRESCGGIPRTPKGRLRLSSRLARPQTAIPGWKTRPREWGWQEPGSGWDQWLGSVVGNGREHWWDCWLSLSGEATKQTLPPGTGSTHVPQDAGGAHSHVFIWGFPFPDGHPPPKAWICRCGLGQEAGTAKTANERREGVVMDAAPAATGDVPKEAAEDWEWERVGMLQHQSICWQRHSGWYKLGERLWMRYRKGHVDYGTAGSSLEQQGSRTLETLLFAKGAKQTFPA